MVIAGACTYPNRDVSHQPLITSKKRAEKYIFDDTLPRTDGVPIVELVLGKVELRHFRPVLNLIDRSLKLGLAEGHER